MQGNWNPEVELCGVIDLQGDIVECVNLARYPQDAFQFEEEDLQGVAASWHSHPKTSANLSIQDFYFFKSWPSILHFVIASSEVRCFAVLNGTVYLLDQEEDHPSRLLERSVRSSD